MALNDTDRFLVQRNGTSYRVDASLVKGPIEEDSGNIRPRNGGQDFVPRSDGNANLGNASLRWSNIYTQDMHFSNEGTEGNSIDGTTGDWTLQEGAEHLYFINNKTGMKFRVVMEEV
jgi:hypothetical protein